MHPVSKFFLIIAVVPIAYAISAFVLGYYLLTGESDFSLKLGVLLTLIISSTAVVISVTIPTIHYWTHWKMRELELHPAKKQAEIKTDR